MNKINLKSQVAQNKTVQEIFDEAERGQAFICKYPNEPSGVIVIKCSKSGSTDRYLIDVADGCFLVKLDYIETLTPIDIEINQI